MNDGAFPIVAVASATKAIVQNPKAASETLTAEFVVLAGAGPVPNNPNDPYATGDDVVVGITPGEPTATRGAPGWAARARATVKVAAGPAVAMARGIHWRDTGRVRHVDLDEGLFPALHDVDVRRVAFAMAMTYAGVPSAFTQRRFGSATAVRDASRPDVGLFNRVIGFGRGDLACLDEIIAFYEEARVPCQIDLTPNHATPELLAALDARGFGTTGASCVFRGSPEPSPRDGRGIVIAHATGPALADALDLHRRFGQRPPLGEAERARRVAFLSEHPEYRMFVASIDGQPAAVGALLLLGDACHLANDCTDPSMWRRGCQRALLEHRIDVAAREGCRLAVTDTMFGTSSHRNVERSGFRLVYNLVWRVRPLTFA